MIYHKLLKLSAILRNLQLSPDSCRQCYEDYNYHNKVVDKITEITMMMELLFSIVYNTIFWVLKHLLIPNI